MAAAAFKQTEAAKKIAPKSPPPALDALNGPRAHPNDVVLVDLDQIIVSTMNPRHDRDVEDAEPLAANIAKYGLLHPLVCHMDGKHYAAINGRRRRAALQLLADRGQWPKGETGRIKVVVIDDFHDAPGVALSEDLMRVAMNPADEARTFAKMADCTQSPTIAKVFGRSVKFVEGRLRLANLHPPILDALSRNQITIDTAQAYGRAPSSESEEAAWRKFGVDGHAGQIRRHFEAGAMKGSDRLCKFVGEDAYLTAGGQISRDLFSDVEAALWLNPDIVNRLADEKLAAAREQIAAEGWAEVKASVEEDAFAYADRSLGKKRKPTPAEKADLDDIKKRSEALQEKLAALPDDSRFNDEAERLDEQIADLGDARQRIEAALIEYKPAERAASGALVSIGLDGALTVTRAVHMPKASSAKSGKHAERGKASSETTAPQPPMTAAQHARLTAAAGEVVARALEERPHIALVALAAWLAREVFAHATRESEPLDFQASSYDVGGHARVDAKTIKLYGDAKREEHRKMWKAELAPFWKTAGAVEIALSKWPVDKTLTLIGFCVGEHMHVAESHSERPNKTRRLRLAALGALANADPFNEFAPDVELFKGMRRDMLDQAAKTIGIDNPEKKTKAALAAMCADRAEAAKYVHPVMAEMCGASAKPAAAAKAKAKTPAKKPAAKKAVRK